MSNYMRAIGLCLRRPWTLALALLCSFGVAGFWGANIGAVYPLMEVLFSGRSLPQAVDEDIAASKTAIQDADNRIGRFFLVDLEGHRMLTKQLDRVDNGDDSRK